MCHDRRTAAGVLAVSSNESVTLWLEKLKRGEQSAAQALYDRYEQKLIRLAREKLRTAPRRAADEEDAVLSAFDSFFRGVQNNRFAKLEDRQDLWKLLVTITVRKCWDMIEHELREKRGGGKVRGESAFDAPAGADADVRGIEQVFDREPTPAEAAELAAETERLLAMLPDEIRQIALWKLEGYSASEIAEKLGWIKRRVERHIVRIRNIWRAAGLGGE